MPNTLHPDKSTTRILFATLGELLSATRVDPSATVLLAPNGQQYRAANVTTVTSESGKTHEIELLEDYDV